MESCQLLDSKVAVGFNCSESTLGSEGYASPNSTFSCLTSKLARFGSFNLELESLADLQLDGDLSTTFSNFWGVIPNLKTPQEILDELCRGFFDTLDGCKIFGEHSSNDSSKGVFIGKEEKAKTVLKEATNVVKEYNSIEDSDLLVNICLNLNTSQLHKLQNLSQGFNETQRLCNIRRPRYIRNSLNHLITKLQLYEKNPKFSIENPFQYEFTRVERSKKTLCPINSSREGLCPYCPGLCFFKLRDHLNHNHYSEHLANVHGVFADNYLTPNPYGHGKYRQFLKQSKYDSIETDPYVAVSCPVCCQLIEITDDSLDPYMMHFRIKHRVSKLKNLDSIRFYKGMLKLDEASEEDRKLFHFD
ncbi:hypothetical protein HYPBUDRAFT_146313 [Hyphopichia burtonii NRRL Y-1933]|uniref:Transcription regulator Rua1 C-terminal domain-containing protein n=1 Tax=Hyphopichia burtonii NRRL Y-1933 TaxID=984485 RepID=A0A1E4RRQ2_9ASCO|nr:hypothetical protein HYPBUDRAFT_146313 [Hyphopichia burtonii NRRL Y-1933]ODV69927.1 hypothetical protein HYPBUDRAFT_146313 [Hyphopichia burtonii NRRL Y-1933]